VKALHSPRRSHDLDAMNVDSSWRSGDVGLSGAGMRGRPKMRLTAAPANAGRRKGRLYRYRNIVLLIPVLPFETREHPVAATGVDAERLRWEACIRLTKQLIGGVGVAAGALLGSVIFGLTIILINFNGSLGGASLITVVGLLLFLFVVLQRFLMGSFRPQSAV
jgi:hypothetical protein